MSAIFGIIDFAGRPLEDEWIASMQKDLAHRGPDGQGLYQEPSVAMGHLLLQVTPESIYDKSPYEEDGFVITAYARLDEREAIMKRLNIPLEERDKITDPLLLLRSFRKFGQDFVKDIYGDFAFAIWNKEKKELFCARDQMGVKPFLYYYKDNRFVFSTEIKSLVNLTLIQSEADLKLIKRLLIGLDNEIHKTIWKGILRLRPAHTLEVNNKDIHIVQYWFLNNLKRIKYKNLNECALEFKKLIERAIIDRLRTFYNVGVPLSGGLDSSIIACIASRQLIHKFNKLYSVSSILDPESDVDEIDEMEFIQSVIEQEKNIEPLFVKNTDIKEIFNINSSFQRQYDIPNLFYYMDNAILDKLQENKIKLVVSGLLGDCTVSNFINPIPTFFQKLKFKKVYKYLLEKKKQSKSKLLVLMYTHLFRPLMPIELKNYIQKRTEKDVLSEIKKTPLLIEEKELKSIKKGLLQNYLFEFRNEKDIYNSIWSPERDEFKEEYNCQAAHHHLEYVFPYADRRIVEFLFQIPIEYLAPKGKVRGLIRLSMSNILPEKVRLRTSKGDYSPGFLKIFINELNTFNTILIKDSLLNNSLKKESLIRIINDVKKLEDSDNLPLNIWISFKLLYLYRFLHWLKLNDLNLK